jgi:tRNA pseudouridine38-40 synthase
VYTSRQTAVKQEYFFPTSKAPRMQDAVESREGKRMIRAHVCYIGTHYCGWQRQSEQVEKRKPSVQGKLEIAVKQWCGEHVDVVATSRTDAGTHALMNYCHILMPMSKLAETTLGELMEQLNALLHHTIRVRRLEPVPGFHKCRKTKGKRYHYYVQQGPRRLMEHARECWYIPKILNIAQLEEALSYLEGKHDLKYFTSGKAAAIPADSFRLISSATLSLLDSVDFSLTGHGQTVMAEKRQTELRASSIGGVMPEAKTDCYFLRFSFTANGFLTHNVRRIMGTLRQVGELACPNGAMHIKEVQGGRAASGPSSPAHGLWLDHIWMPDEASVFSGEAHSENCSAAQADRQPATPVPSAEPDTKRQCVRVEGPIEVQLGLSSLPLAPS